MSRREDLHGIIGDAANGAKNAMFALGAVMHVNVPNAKSDATKMMDYLSEGENRDAMIEMLDEINRANEEDSFERIMGLAIGLSVIITSMVALAVGAEEKPQGLEREIRGRLDAEKLNNPDSIIEHIQGVMKEIGLPPMPDEVLKKMFSDDENVIHGDGFTVYRVDGNSEPGGFDEEEYE